MNIVKLNSSRDASAIEKNFSRFLAELETISNRHGVALVGRIKMFDPGTERIVYDLSSVRLAPSLRKK